MPWAVEYGGQTVHPSQLYAAAAALAALVMLLAIRNRLPKEGDLFKSYLIIFGLSRFAIEFTRWHDPEYSGLSLAQWISLALAAGGAFALILGARKTPGLRRNPAGDRMD